ncbi:MAG: hypothetical protein LBL62_06725 [Planctomycetaceae bacterium]|nr:hypothetical protein [Planctomycetaceae bacterium]
MRKSNLYALTGCSHNIPVNNHETMSYRTIILKSTGAGNRSNLRWATVR